MHKNALISGIQFIIDPKFPSSVQSSRKFLECINLQPLGLLPLHMSHLSPISASFSSPLQSLQLWLLRN